jgi:hypothetical protein
MYRSCKHRIIVALVLVTFLMSPWAAAAEPRSTVEPGGPLRVATLPLDFMIRLWNFVDRAFTKTICSLDLHGGCTSTAPTVQEDTGCGIDPNGGCGK